MSPKNIIVNAYLQGRTIIVTQASDGRVDWSEPLGCKIIMNRTEWLDARSQRFSIIDQARTTGAAASVRFYRLSFTNARRRNAQRRMCKNREKPDTRLALTSRPDKYKCLIKNSELKIQPNKWINEWLLQFDSVMLKDRHTHQRSTSCYNVRRAIPLPSS